MGFAALEIRLRRRTSPFLHHKHTKGLIVMYTLLALSDKNTWLIGRLLIAIRFEHTIIRLSREESLLSLGVTKYRRRPSREH
jgi:hypothetical protein